MTDSLRFMRLDPWSRRPPHAGLSQLRSRSGQGPRRGRRGQKGDNRQNLSCPPSTWLDRAAIADRDVAGARTRYRQPILHPAHACSRSPRRRRRFAPPRVPRGCWTSQPGRERPPSRGANLTPPLDRGGRSRPSLSGHKWPRGASSLALPPPGNAGDADARRLVVRAGLQPT